MDVESLPLGGPIAAVGAAREAAAAVAREVAAGAVSHSGGNGSGASQPMQLAAAQSSGAGLQSIVFAAGANGGGSTAGSRPVQRQPVGAIAPSGDNHVQSPAASNEQMNALIDAIQQRILTEIERRGGRFRGGI